jgi:hypothetical protein
MRDMAGADVWTIHESASFVEDAGSLLSDFELEALRYQLARDPFAGSEVRGQAPLMSIEYAGATIVYLVKPGRKLLWLLEIAPSAGGTEAAEAEPRALKLLLDTLRKAGYYATGRGLWELVRKLLEEMGWL